MNNKKCNMCKAKGFTLIEVIIAVSIVVILASLTVPKVTGYIGKAKNAKALNAGKQIYTAAMWSYSDQGNTIDETQIKNTIADTMADVSVSSVVKGENSVTVKFLSDNVTYAVVINTSESSYTVSKATL
jgi:type IV pilus assembly protein PilA